MDLPRDHTLRPGAEIRIGDFTIDAARQSIQRQGERQPLPIHRSSLDLLLVLAGRAGGVVSKEELLATVWPGRVVSENSLQQAVRKLRLTLGDDKGEAIQLVRGFGYRLALPVRIGAANDDPPGGLARNGSASRAPMDPAAIETIAPPRVRPGSPPGRPRSLLWGALATLVLVSTGAAVVTLRDSPPRPQASTTERRVVQEFQNTLAVLPFADLSDDGSLAQEALLLADGMRRNGHSIPQLHSAGEADVRSFRGSPGDAEAVLAELDSDLVLAGSVRPLPDGIELALRLVDHSGQGLGFERRYTYARGDLGGLQAQLKFDLFEHLGGTPGRWAHDAARGRGTANREAWLAFLRAATLLGDDETGQRRAKAALEQAVANLLIKGYLLR